MTALHDLENYAIFLQKTAYLLLKSPNMKKATLSKLVGEATLFDRDLSTILTVLYSHNNLSGKGQPDASKPVSLLKSIKKDLSARGFYFPSFSRRLEHIDTATDGSFERKEPSDYGGGNYKALDRPLRSLQEKIYEVRLHDAGHAQDDDGNDKTERTGEETLGIIRKLIESVKSLETEGSPYFVNDSGQSSSKPSQFLDDRYDELGSKLNFAVGSSAEGEKIELLHLHPIHRDDLDRKTYAVSEEYYSLLLESVGKAIPGGWNPSDQFEYVKDLIPSEQEEEDVTEDSSSKTSLKEERAKELEILTKVSQDGSYGSPVVRVVTLPFAPDQIDDSFPSLELHSDEYLGQNLSKVVIESINQMRFSGFVDFDQNYRMMILWANAPSDDKKDARGDNYRDLLERVLKSYEDKYGSLLGVDPIFQKTKRGAALYFPKTIGLEVLVRSFTKLQGLINQTNTSIGNAEVSRGLERAFNREIDDDELPAHMEMD